MDTNINMYIKESDLDDCEYGDLGIAITTGHGSCTTVKITFAKESTLHVFVNRLRDMYKQSLRSRGVKNPQLPEWL